MYKKKYIKYKKKYIALSKIGGAGDKADEETLKLIEVAELTEAIANLNKERDILVELSGLRTKFEEVSLPTAIFTNTIFTTTIPERLEENQKLINDKKLRLETLTS
tara:strand:+ start:411 stop:728 length:318 start_codon:yes stop_codon:yes gene_type:complete